MIELLYLSTWWLSFIRQHETYGHRQASMQLNIYVKTNIYLHTYIYISIIHPRCIKEVFSNATVFIADFGLFCIISAPTETPAWIWKSQAVSLITTCYAHASTKAKKFFLIRLDFGHSYRHLSFSNSQWKTGHSTLLYYISYHLYLSLYIYAILFLVTEFQCCRVWK